MAKIFVLAPDSFKESMTAEQACQAMFNAGMVWLSSRENPDLKAQGLKGVYGIVVPTSPDAKELEDVCAKACPDGGPTGAMIYAVMGRVIWVSRNGWDKYVSECKTRHAKEVGTC